MTITGSESVVAGLDIGGTATRIVIRRDGDCLDTLSVPTATFNEGTSDERVDRLAALVRERLPEGVSLAAVGIGASGPVDVEKGHIRNIYTLPALSGFSITTALERRLGCPVLIESDAVVAAIAEHRLGAGGQASRMLMVTLGTGIGVSMLIAGQPFRGEGGAHPEGGHIPIGSGTVRCYCGTKGCWEQQASRAAFQARLRPMVPPGTPEDQILLLAASASGSNSLIRKTFQAYGRLVGRGLATLHTLYMPSVTVLGGSASAHVELFGTGLKQQLYRTPDFDTSTAVRIAVLGEAGAIGAALLAEQHVASASLARLCG